MVECITTLGMKFYFFGETWSSKFFMFDSWDFEDVSGSLGLCLICKLACPMNGFALIEHSVWLACCASSCNALCQAVINKKALDGC